jgi:hypothetical protein
MRRQATEAATCTCHGACAKDREARLICWAPKVFMLKQSRQQLKFQALLAERAHFMLETISIFRSASIRMS